MSKLENNSLLQNKGLPKYSDFKVEEVEPAITYLTDKLEKDFELLEKRMDAENESYRLYNAAIEEVEKIQYPLDYAWGIIRHLHSVKNNDDLRDVYSKMQPVIIKSSNRISQSKILYNSLLRLKEMGNMSDVR